MDVTHLWWFEAEDADAEDETASAENGGHNTRDGKVCVLCVCVLILTTEALKDG